MIVLPYPHKALWPNGRAHWGAKSTQTKKHHAWARAAANGIKAPETRPIQLVIHVYGKPRGPLPDADNCVAASKAYIDGIAAAIGVNDREFAAPKVEFASARKTKFEIEVLP